MPHDGPCPAKGAPKAASELVAGCSCLRRLGPSSSKVHTCLWNWHITHAVAAGEMPQRIFLLRQLSQGRSGGISGPCTLETSPTRALVDDVIPLTILGDNPTDTRRVTSTSYMLDTESGAISRQRSSVQPKHVRAENLPCVLPFNQSRIRWWVSRVRKD